MASPTALNHDILHLVMSLSSTREVCSMMETCKLLHREGAKFLLHKVELRDERDIQSFTRFMATDPYHRIRYLRSIYFHCGHLFPDTALLLRLFLEFSAPFLSLRYLQLMKPEDLLRSDIGLIQAFSRIRHTSTLTVHNPGTLSLSLLGKMSSIVHSASLSFDEARWRSVQPPEDSNLILAFRSLRNTLVEISGHLFAANVAASRAAGIVFPHVHTLRLETSISINSADYARAFPNVAFLHVACVVWGIDESDRDRLAMLRESNRRSLREEDSWSTLECFEGSVVDFWTLGLQGAVEELTLSMGPMYEPHQAIAAVIFEECLRDVHIKHVDLSVWMSSVARDALRALPRTCRNLQHLSLCIKVDPEEPLADVTEMLDALIDLAGVGILQSLDVAFQCTEEIFAFTSRDIESTGQSREECIQLLQPEALADRIQARAPSLTNISVKLCGGSESEPLMRLLRGDGFPRSHR